ncbi:MULTISPECIES: TraB/TrbI/VirB10 family type IV secretion system protein [unclassified Novosphingobium]|uniref:TrbI/VirB10 family protein n=1 Tax=unclassified Novosphingobium TaxID=2644732 RepID=UPI00086AF87E|nr:MULTISPECIES: TrbI/VirB10 family protein [unclassified Novosphingobium]MBN9144645.1 TrbI/VirB10 family protein [Novosphingobium sp.]ODU77848.1 MAG: conjugal transfer protein TrbI [Novosphingobium sp. SCN 63-17]OJX92063.1 MAG: conjugal transfer protein TrbI [Novosphingobium sp. 63-713]
MSETPNGEPQAEAVQETSQAEAPRKLDPESLVLRGRPRGVVRFRKELIIGIAAVAMIGIGAVAWIGLQPSMPHMIVGGDDNTSPASAPRPSGELLANAPKTYGEVPKLGPPLPGDLGKPILDQQRAAVAVSVAGAPSPSQRDQALAAERQRRGEEVRAARESGVMMQMAGGTQAGQGTGIPAAMPVSVAGAGDAAQDARPGRMVLDPEHDPGQQQRKADFVAATNDKSDLNPHAVVALPSPYTLMAGTVIAASLITGVNSDLPGLVSAQVTQNVYDTATGRYLLLPQGARLIGSYDSVVAYGQKRALLVWQRIILPDGSSVKIDNVPATDTAGYAGLADKVDLHSWQLIKGVVLSSLLGVGTQLSFGNDESDLLRAIRQSTQQSASRAGDQIVRQALNIQPTITVRPGWPLRVVVHKDIVMRPWGREGR